MSQEQSKKPEESSQPEPITYGDVFPVSDELASKPIAPEDAAMMQTAETTVLGQTQKGGPAAVMQAAAVLHERAGFVGHNDVTDIAGGQGVTVTETDLPGRHIITESIAGQVIGQFSKPIPISIASPGETLQDRDAITVGEALEATAITAADKAVERCDAAAIQAAEMRATDSTVASPGGVSAVAQSAASVDESVIHYEEKIKLGDVLVDASSKMATDKEVTIEDAGGVVGAEVRNKPDRTTCPGGVADTISSAAMMNLAPMNRQDGD